VQGVYTFRLTVTDNEGSTDSDDMIVTVNAAINQPPVANAGMDQSITLPVNSVSLSGSASDGDGTIASYQWSKLSGPVGESITSASSASTTVNGLVQGTYTFRLTVRDNDGATAFDDVVITVNAAPSSSFGKIEAENWSAMNGVRTETTYDLGGGLNVGWIDQGDWMDYSINPPSSGTYTLNLRIATPNNGAQLQIRKGDGTVLSTVNLPNTGAYQKWQTTTTTVTLSAGVQTIRVISTAAALWNINWLEFASGTASRIAAFQQNEETFLFELFPNPATDHVNVTISNPYRGKMKLQMVNINGAVVRESILYKEKGIIRTSLKTGDLPAGNYIIKLSTDKRLITKQIIKQ
jgi:hypothetical protein